MFVRNRLLVGLFVLATTAVAIWGYVPKPVEPPSTQNSGRRAAERSRDTRPASERVDSEFNITRSDCLLVVESEKLFEPDTMNAIRQMISDVDELNVVDNVIWLDSVPVLNMFGLPKPLIPPPEASPDEFVEARERALEHPLVRGQLLSDDGSAMQVPIRLEWLFMSRDDSGGPEIVETARKSLEASLGDDADSITLRMTGRVPLWMAERAAFTSDHHKYQIIAYTMIVVLAMILFRGLVPVLLVIAAPAMAVFWTFGWLKVFDHTTNDMTSVVMPVLIAMVSFTDGVHLMIHIRRRRADGLSPIESAASAIRHVGLPCFLTSLTTAIGFCSLLLASSEYIQDFGVDCAVGVTFGFIAVITVIPLLSSTWLGRNLQSHQEDDLVARSLSRFTPAIDAILQNSRKVTIAGVALTAVLAYFAFQLRPDEKWEYAMPTGAPAYQAMAWCDEEFGGIEFARISILWDEETTPEPAEILQVIRESQASIGDESLLKHPLSLDDLLKTFPTDETDPETLMTFADLMPPPIRDLLYNESRHQAYVLMRCQDKGIRLYAPVFDRLDERLNAVRQEHPGFTIQLDGRPVWRARNLYQIVVDLASSLGMASLIIMVILAVVYRSLRIGLIAVIPNMLPLIVTGALLVATGYALNIAAVCAFTVCLGIAVDDTIHFLSRFQDEVAKGDGTRPAVQRTFLGVGTALVTTTIVLVCGFATVLASQMPAHRIFAGMAVSTIGTALIGDLLLLPAMLDWFYRRDDGPTEAPKLNPPPSGHENLMEPTAVGAENK